MGINIHYTKIAGLEVCGGKATKGQQFIVTLITIAEAAAVVIPLVALKKILGSYEEGFKKYLLTSLVFIAVMLLFKLIINPLIVKVLIEPSYNFIMGRINAHKNKNQQQILDGYSDSGT